MSRCPVCQEWDDVHTQGCPENPPPPARPTAPETPELDRRAAIINSGKTETLTDFINWIGSNGYAIAHLCDHRDQQPGRRCWRCGDSGFSGPAHDFERLIALHFDLDPAKIEEELRLVLEYQRALNDAS